MALSLSVGTRFGCHRNCRRVALRFLSGLSQRCADRSVHARGPYGFGVTKSTARISRTCWHSYGLRLSRSVLKRSFGWPAFPVDRRRESPSYRLDRTVQSVSSHTAPGAVARWSAAPRILARGGADLPDAAEETQAALGTFGVGSRSSLRCNAPSSPPGIDPRRARARSFQWPIESANNKMRLITRLGFGCRTRGALNAMTMLGLGGQPPQVPSSNHP